MLAAIAWGCARALRTRGADPVARTVLLLGGRAAAFALATAIGRVCLGLGAGAAPRYTPYVVPGLLACWLWLRERAPEGRWKQVALAAALAVCVGKEGLLEVAQDPELARVSAGKRAVRECLRELRDLHEGAPLQACTERARFLVYPEPLHQRAHHRVGRMGRCPPCAGAGGAQGRRALRGPASRSPATPHRPLRSRSASPCGRPASSIFFAAASTS